MKEKLIKYTVQSVIAAGLSVLFMYERGLFEATNTADRVKYISDGFAIVAFLYLAVGVLVWISTTGFFDVFSYGVRKFAHLFIPGMVKETAGKFLDFRAERIESREGKKTNWSMLILGGIFLLAAGITSIIWYQL